MVLLQCAIGMGQRFRLMEAIMVARHAVFFGLLGAGIACHSVFGQHMLSSSNAGIHVSDGQGLLWSASTGETYAPQFMDTRLRSLRDALFQYAIDHDDQVPDQLSTLFLEGYVDEPGLFYSLGDVDLPPATIDNDVPNTPDSALISYDYPFRGDIFSAPPDDIILIDNTADNHAGLGRMVLFADGHRSFEPSDPHVFSSVRSVLPSGDDATIRRAPDFVSVPFPLPLSNYDGQVVAGPGHQHIAAEGSLTQDILDVLAVEGFSTINTVSSSGLSQTVFPEMRILGPEQSDATLVTYVGFSGVLSRPMGETSDFVTVNVTMRWSNERRAEGAFAALLNHSIGPIATPPPDVVVLEHRRIQPGEDEFVPGADTVFMRGIAQLSIDVPTGESGRFSLASFAGVSFRPTPQTRPAGLGRAVLESRWPVTDGDDQIRLFAPRGFEVHVVPTHGSDDLLLAVERGDVNLDNEIDGVDHDAFADAYSGPVPSVNYNEPTLAALQTFDFDGDGDLDCADRAVHVSAWTGDGAIPVLAACASDDDADGVPVGDDDCPGTIVGTVVDQRGCPNGDFNADGDVDLDDWSAFVGCRRGTLLQVFPEPPFTIPQCLNAFDRNADGAVDLVDFGPFQAVFGG